MADPAPPAAPRLLTGLSAFPLTPIADETDAGIDEIAFRALVTRAATAGVDSITVLGSTGSYAYLTRDERRHVVQLAVQEAGDVPVLAGVGATRTRDVLRHIDDAQQAGAAALLLAPVSYQPLSDDEVYALFEDVAAAVSVPVVVYDNLRVTSAVAEELGLVQHPNLPRPVRGLDTTTRRQVRDAIATMRANGVPGLDPVR